MAENKIARIHFWSISKINWFWYNLSKFNDYKIFLLSRINENDAKQQIVLKLTFKQPLINYHYFDHLIPKKLIENIITNFEPKENKDTIIKILEQFDYLPKYIFIFL